MIHVPPRLLYVLESFEYGVLGSLLLAIVVGFALFTREKGCD